MSKSHCLPQGAPVLRLYNGVEGLWLSDEEPEEKKTAGNDGDEDSDDPDELEDRADSEEGQSGVKSTKFLLNLAGTQPQQSPVPRKRGKDSKPVDQLLASTGQLVRRYSSQTDACNSMKISQIYVSECCRGMRNECFGFKWRFRENAPKDGANLFYSSLFT